MAARLRRSDYLSWTVRSAGLELRFRLLGVLFRDLLENGLGGGVDEVLRLLQPEARERADLLDHLDLLVASRGENDVELVLLFGLRLATAAPPAVGAAATAAGAAAVTPKRSSNSFRSSESSRTVMFAISSRMLCLLAIAFLSLSIGVEPFDLCGC